MDTGWNKKNVLWQLLYVVLYMIGFLIVCFSGAIHPILFVLYQVTAAVLVTGVLVKAFDQTQAFGVAITFSIGVILAFVATGDVSLWHCLPVVIIGVLAEAVGLICGQNKWKTVVTKSVLMSFGTFGFYGQIWLNRAYTYECAIEEMPAGYADTLMNCSPNWAFPAVILAGIVISILLANLTAKMFKLNTK